MVDGALGDSESLAGFVRGICAGEEADPLVMSCMSTSIRLQK